MPPWLIILLLAGPMLLWAAGAAIRLYRLRAPLSVRVTHLPASGRRIKAFWSPNPEDMGMVYIPSEAEREQLIDHISREIALEIDAEIQQNLHTPFSEDRLTAGTDKFLARLKGDPNE